MFFLRKKIIFLGLFFVLFLFFFILPRSVFAQAIVYQNYFRWYVNEDATDPIDPWPEGGLDLGENAAITLADSPPAVGTVLRIRMSLQVDPGSPEPLNPGTLFKLQFGEKAASCDGITWNDVVGASLCGPADAWCGYDNPTPADGEAINVPLLSVTQVLESYEEENPTDVQLPINAGQDGEWDWAIYNNAATANTTYCFRMVRDTNEELNGYYYYPELTTQAVTVSGRVYSGEGVGALGNKTVVLKVNGADKCNGTGLCTAETGVDGFYSISNVDIDATNDVVTVFLSGENEKAVAVTKAADSTSDIENLDLYQNRVIVKQEIGASATTNTDLGQYDKDQEPIDIHFTSNGGVLTIDNDHELHIWTGKTFAPGGSVTISSNNTCSSSSVDASLHIDDNAVFLAGGPISVGGHWTADSGATFTHNNNDVTFTATGSGCSITANSQHFYNVIFNGSGGEWSFSDDTEIDNDLTMTAGTLKGTQNLGVNGGDVTGDGTISFTAGTFKLKGSGSFGGNTAWTFFNLTFGETGSDTTYATGTGAIEIDGILTINNSHTLDAGSKTWNLDANASCPFVVSGTFIANTSTFKYTGTDPLSQEVNVTAVTYYNLMFDDGIDEVTYKLAGTVNVNGDLTITDGNLDVTTANHPLNVKGSWANNDTFTAQAGTVTFNGTSSGKTIKTGGSSFYNLTINGLGGVWTLATDDLNVTNSILLSQGTLNAGNQNITVGSNLQIDASASFIKGSGTFTFQPPSPPPPAGSYWLDNTPTKQDLGAVVIAGSIGARLDLGSSVKCTKLTLANDNTMNLGSHTLTLTGSGTGIDKPLNILAGAIFNTDTSTVEYTGSSDTEVTRLTAPNYYNLKINGSGTFFAETSGDWNIDNNLSVVSGTFNLGGTTTVANDVFISGILDVTTSNYDLLVGGSWINSGGIFNSRGGSVTFNSGSSEQITTNNQAFYQLTFNNSLGSWELQDALDVNSGFNLAAGSLIQAADADINFGGNVSFASGTTFTKASGSGRIVFDGTNATFYDSNSTKQNLGNVHIGTSPDELVLCTDTVMDSLTINSGDILYTNGFDLDVATSINVHSIATLDAETNRSDICLGAGDSTLINLGTDWTVASDGAFLAGDSTVTFDGMTDSNLDSGGTDESHDFNNLVISKSDINIKTVTLINNHLNVRGNLTIANAFSALDVSVNNYNINIGGSWSNSGTFIAQQGTVTFDSADTGETIDSGGTGAGKNFYNIDFNNAAGGWTIQNNSLTATNNFTITAANTFIISDIVPLTITVNGIFTNLVGGANTTWTGTLNLTRTSGSGSYTINTKSAGGDVYDSLQIGANTDVRMWDSSASSYTIDSSGSLYSMDHQGISGRLDIWGDYHTLAGQTDYWNYSEDFDGAPGANRQVKVYLQVAGATHPSVTVDDSGILNVKGGGSIAGDITIVGQDATALWNFACYGTCNVQESTWNYLNLTGGTLTVYNTILNNEDAPDAGTLNVDWYLGDYVVDRATLAPVDTADNDITISENSSTPAPTVFVWSAGTWSAGATSQTTGTGADGKIPQPGTDGAIKIREYTRTAAGYTFYKYNLYITWQGSTYGEYDYYRGYGRKYITSSLVGLGEDDECISELWQRNDIDKQNDPAQAIDDPPTNGTWYNGMISGLSFTVASVTSDNCTITGGAFKITTSATAIPYSVVNPQNFYDACQSLTVSTSASNGYTITVQETDQLTEPVNNNQISDGNCDGGCDETTSAAWNEPTNNGFAYCMDDIVGSAAATAQPVNWASAKQCGGSSQSFMILPEKGIDDPDRAEIMKSTGPVSGDNSYIGFRLSVNARQQPGTYSTTIIYVITPRY